MIASLFDLFSSITDGDRAAVDEQLATTPSLVTLGLSRADECFLERAGAQIYEGDTALHVAAFSHDATIARLLLTVGSDVRARNRRGAEPLHSATMGGPGRATWDSLRQQEVIVCLVEAGAAIDARASGGVTPLHRAVRNRCAGAVETLLRLGADPRLRNDSGSTAADLARWTTGRPGSGSAAARAQQQIISELLSNA